ncbi:hypothetical protein AC625_10915 [Peribacillus loiseleuriae]|uniref:Uncharacterized protein n=1 Tax=Peribacillus loiseleuriae TaxID=1679170 RepID=A0A0K9GTG6_9BACI|nr:hypothetical protein AC625_10915 [Peribacillus loiseleuriae]
MFNFDVRYPKFIFLGNLVIKRKCVSLKCTLLENIEVIITPKYQSESNKTILSWLKEPSVHPLPKTFLKVIERLEYIQGIDLETISLVCSKLPKS